MHDGHVAYRVDRLLGVAWFNMRVICMLLALYTWKYAVYTLFRSRTVYVVIYTIFPCQIT